MSQVDGVTPTHAVSSELPPTQVPVTGNSDFYNNSAPQASATDRFTVQSSIKGQLLGASQPQLGVQPNFPNFQAVGPLISAQPYTVPVLTNPESALVGNAYYPAANQQWLHPQQFRPNPQKHVPTTGTQQLSFPAQHLQGNQAMYPTPQGVYQQPYLAKPARPMAPMGGQPHPVQPLTRKAPLEEPHDLSGLTGLVTKNSQAAPPPNHTESIEGASSALPVVPPVTIGPAGSPSEQLQQMEAALNSAQAPAAPQPQPVATMQSSDVAPQNPLLPQPTYEGHPHQAVQHNSGQAPSNTDNQSFGYTAPLLGHQGDAGTPMYQAQGHGNIAHPVQFIPPGSSVIQPGPAVIQPSNAFPMTQQMGTGEGSEGQSLQFQPTRQLVGSRKRRSGQTPLTKDDIQQSGSSESWSFLPGTTKTGKRRRRHPVAEVKGNWTPEEDAKLMELVKKHGVGCWSKLLPEFQGRIGKQLRERWNHELRPDINKEGWTHDEERQLVEAHRKVGNSWAEIAKVLTGRTQNGVKNHWHATMRKVSRAPTYANPSTPLQAYLRELNNGTLQAPPTWQKGQTGQSVPAELGTSNAVPEATADDTQAESLEKAAEGHSEDEGERREGGTRATGRRSRLPRVANDAFHLQLQSRSPSPEPHHTSTKKKRRRLNAEELAVADGLLGLQEANNANSDTATSEESPPPPGAGRKRRPSAKALAATQGAAGKRRLRQKRLTFTDSNVGGLSDLGSSAREGSGEGLVSGSFLAMVANAAVAVDGLKRVGATQCGAQEEEMVQTALESPQLSKLRRYLAHASQSEAGGLSGGQGLNSIIKRFAELPDMWVLYDVLKQEG